MELNTIGTGNENGRDVIDPFRVGFAGGGLTEVGDRGARGVREGGRRRRRRHVRRRRVLGGYPVAVKEERRQFYCKYDFVFNGKVTQYTEVRKKVLQILQSYFLAFVDFTFSPWWSTVEIRDSIIHLYHLGIWILTSDRLL